MTREDKDLLLKDLCARLPYGAILCVNNGLIFQLISVNALTYQVNVIDYRVDVVDYGNTTYNIEQIKPYLRPMSSMTEEEKKDILQSLNIHGDIDNEGNLLLGVECDIITLKVCKKYLGELNKRMFDVCHMIEKGLALEAPEGMYNLEKK